MSILNPLSLSYFSNLKDQLYQFLHQRVDLNPDSYATMLGYLDDRNHLSDTDALTLKLMSLYVRDVVSAQNVFTLDETGTTVVGLTIGSNNCFRDIKRYQQVQWSSSVHVSLQNMLTFMYSVLTFVNNQVQLQFILDKSNHLKTTVQDSGVESRIKDALKPLVRYFQSSCPCFSLLFYTRMNSVLLDLVYAGVQVLLDSPKRQTKFQEFLVTNSSELVPHCTTAAPELKALTVKVSTFLDRFLHTPVLTLTPANEESKFCFRFYAKSHQGEKSFTCELVQKKCKKPQCNRLVSVGLPFCLEHTRDMLQLEVKPSLIPNAGLGLFAYNVKRGKKRRPVFKAGTEIVSYKGNVLSLQEIEKLYGSRQPGSLEFTAPYTIKWKNKYIDSACKRGIGSMLNYSQVPNALFEDHAGGVFIKARRDIYHGDEITADYGPNYFLSTDKLFIQRHRTTVCKK